jgi:hypothetical protein
MKKYEIEIAFMQGIQKILLGKGNTEEVMNELNKKIGEIISE